MVPFFILGAPRSGTSLLSRIMNAHSDIGIPFETQFYRFFFPLRQKYGDLGSVNNRARIVSHLLSNHHVRRIVPLPSHEQVMAHFVRHDIHGALEALMRAWLEQCGKSRWGEKTPQHTLTWPDLLAGFPNAKVIGIVRDGRDVAVSWKQTPFGPKTAFQLATQWARYVDALDACVRALPRDQVHIIHYDDLLAHSTDVVNGLCAFLGVEFQPSMLEFHSSPSSYQSIDAQNSTNLSKPILAANSGKWKTQMSRRDLRIFEAVAGAQLELSGYARACPSAAIGMVERQYIRWLETPSAKAYRLMTSRNGQLEQARRLVILSSLLLRRAPS